MRLRGVVAVGNKPAIRPAVVTNTPKYLQLTGSAANCAAIAALKFKTVTNKG